MPWVTRAAASAAPVGHGSTCVVILARFSGSVGTQLPNGDCCQGPGYLRKWRWNSFYEGSASVNPLDGGVTLFASSSLSTPVLVASVGSVLPRVQAQSVCACHHLLSVSALKGRTPDSACAQAGRTNRLVDGAPSITTVKSIGLTQEIHGRFHQPITHRAFIADRVGVSIKLRGAPPHPLEARSRAPSGSTACSR